MLGRDAQRLAQAQRPALDRAGLAGPPLGLVGDKDDVAGAPAQDVGEVFVGRGDARAGVDHEQADIGLIDRAFGQAAHPALQAVILGHLEPGRIDHHKAQIAQPPGPFAQVARDAGPVIDQREALAHQPVEQGGLADIRPPDDGEGKAHQRNAISWPSWVTTYSVWPATTGPADAPPGISAVASNAPLAGSKTRRSPSDEARYSRLPASTGP